MLTDADRNTPEREKTTVTVVAQPRMETSTLAVNDPNGDEVRPGDLLEYVLTVRNSGNTHATDVRVRLPIAPEAAGRDGDGPGRTTRRRSDGLRETSRIRVAGSDTDVVLQFTGRVRSPMVNGTLVSMQGEISVTELAEPSYTDDPATSVVGDPTIVSVFSAPRSSTRRPSPT